MLSLLHVTVAMHASYLSKPLASSRSTTRTPVKLAVNTAPGPNAIPILGLTLFTWMDGCHTYGAVGRLGWIGFSHLFIYGHS